MMTLTQSQTESELMEKCLQWSMYRAGTSSEMPHVVTSAVIALATL